MSTKWFSKVWNGINSTEKGSALVVALIIMLALTLLGLSLLLQSNTEYVIALNERDSTAALENAEAGLQLAKRVIRDNSGGGSLTNLLIGPDADPATVNDNGIIGLRTVNPAIDSSGLNDDCSVGSVTCESTHSGIEVIYGQPYEVFRVGHGNGSPPPGKSGWEGPRGLVYVRADDNYDEDSLANNPWSDVDKRVIVSVISKYPIRVDSNGVDSGPSKTATLGMAGVSVRRLVGRFGPATTQPAIVSEGDMDLRGGIDVCGECGAVHADGVLTIGATDVDICSDATSTGGGPVMNDGGTAQIGGDVGYADNIDVPVANPFHANYVPSVNMFNTVGDAELTGFPQLQCNSANATKYFALVGDGGNGRVYKAYWKTGTSRWEWELIDQLGDGQNTILDDCGRVVFAGSVHLPDGDADPLLQIDDGSDNQFYDFTYHDAGGSNPSCVAASDKSLGPTSAENNYVDAAAMPSGLPANVLLPATGNPADGTADYDASFVIGNNHHQWTINGNDVWSPLYNSVIWVWGNLNLNGGPKTLCSSADTPPCTTALPGTVWRATFIAFGNIDTSGNPKYAPVRNDSVAPSFQYTLIAGRDIDLSGTPGGGNICPAQCDGTPTVLGGYSGIILAHEQIEITGNVTVNGIVKAEDAAQCSSFANTHGAGIGGSGSAQVYYDCEHPPDNSTQSVRLISWEEIQ